MTDFEIAKNAVEKLERQLEEIEKVHPKPKAMLAKLVWGDAGDEEDDVEYVICQPCWIGEMPLSKGLTEPCWAANLERMFIVEGDHTWCDKEDALAVLNKLNSGAEPCLNVQVMSVIFDDGVAP